MPTPITVLTLRGNAENTHTNMLSGVIAQLPKDRFRHVEVAYPASLGPAGGAPFLPSEMESVRIGCDLLDELIEAAGGGIVLLAYSLGGVVLTEWLNTRKDSRPDLYSKVRLAGFLANPRRAPGRSYGRANVPGEGIFAADQTHRVGWAEFADPTDPMCAMPADSPLRSGSNLIRWMSLIDPVTWALDVLAQLPGLRARELAGGPLRALDPRFWARYRKAADQMYAYAFGGAHTTRYGEKHWRNYKGDPKTAIELLADCVKGIR
ncbi:hypothetical protein [Tsukamurella sp. 1534]|uniref:hypothetical protein n=1 Tax=Tsukamurella sp. 1534 TaxID=1151061 RepID=UPI00031D65C7|nr:hypothetical protein [Tsukamurella sp. 1534]